MNVRPEQLSSRLMPLPSPVAASAGALDDLLRQRRSRRQFSARSLNLVTVARLLWAAQGSTGPDGKRVTPSAGGLYPLEVLLVAGRVDGIGTGLYRYQPREHALLQLEAGDLRPALAAACWGQDFIADAAAILAIAAVYARTTIKYGDRGMRYAQLEAGHAAQNLCLMATALGLHSVVVGAFGDDDVRRVLQLDADESPLVLVPVGARS